MQQQVVEMFPGLPRIEQALRHRMTGGGRSDVMEALGWDKSAMSRFLSCEQGVTIDKLDKLIGAVDFVFISRDYLQAQRTLSKIGNNCECALRGYGECGMNK